MKNTIVRLYSNSMNYRGSTSSWVGGLTLYRLCLSSTALDNCDYTIGVF